MLGETKALMSGERMQQVGNPPRASNASLAGSSSRQRNVSGSRSFDDATVGYGFQRDNTAKQWITEDDSVLQQVYI